MMPLLLVTGLAAYILISGTTGACAICSAITGALGIPSTASSASTAGTEAAPAWTLQSLDGNEVSSADFNGKVVLVDFWATWCPPCRAMVPGMVQLQEEYRDEGFAIVAISLDESGPDAVKAFNRDYGVNYTSLIGSAEVVRDFGGVRSIPTSFLIDREGRIAAKHVGLVSGKKLEAEIKQLL